MGKKGYQLIENRPFSHTYNIKVYYTLSSQKLDFDWDALQAKRLNGFAPGWNHSLRNLITKVWFEFRKPEVAYFWRENMISVAIRIFLNFSHCRLMLSRVFRFWRVFEFRKPEVAYFDGKTWFPSLFRSQGGAPTCPRGCSFRSLGDALGGIRRGAPTSLRRVYLPASGGYPHVNIYFQSRQAMKHS